jgi:VIT1/CCC1 family predicted Fe2+/Mn2+ transporter
MPRSIHVERHRTERIGWLRAAVLGANDGIVSTASLIVGVALLAFVVIRKYRLHERGTVEAPSRRRSDS